MRPLVYSLEFRGLATPNGRGLDKRARAPGCTLATSLSSRGVAARLAWSPGGDEAVLESTLLFTDETGFEEEGRVLFASGHSLLLRGVGQLGPGPDPHLRQGTVTWEVLAGEGQFESASGRISSTLLLSDTGDLTEHQLGLVFAPRSGS